MTLFVSAMVIASGLLFGYSLASIAGVLDAIAHDRGLTIFTKQCLVAVIPASCFFGAILAWPLSAKFGRKPGLAVAFTLAIAGSGVILTTPAVELLFIARAMLGLAVGLSSMIAPMYAAEIVDARRRGPVVASFQLAVTLGILASYTVPYLMPGVQWPHVLGLGGIAALLGLGSLAILPESPRWLATRMQANTPDVSGTFGTAAATRLNVFRQMATRGNTLFVFALCSALFVLQNMSGIDGVLYYAPHIFRELGYSADGAAIAATFGLGLVNFLATIGAMWMVERAGRRPLLIAGSLLMAIGLLTSVAGALAQVPLVGLLGLCLYIFAFAISLGPIPFVLMAELFPTAMRESGIATASAASWLFNMLIAVTFLSFAEAIGLIGVLSFFALVCVVSLVVAVKFVPETRGRSLDDIERDVVSGASLTRR